jgi:HD-GYP domain-containing protein (c-di-GMP phosphodiesterase class II)
MVKGRFLDEKESSLYNEICANSMIRGARSVVRVLLDMCVADIESPADIYQDESRKRLLMKKGVPLTEKAKRLLIQNKVKYLDFPLPFETFNPPPYTFSRDTESAVFCLIRNTFLAFKEDAIGDPLEIRKEAYDILAQAAMEFRKLIRTERPIDDTPPKRHAKSVIHLRTVGALEDYLFEHAKNVALTCIALGYDYFSESEHLLADLHKVGVAGMFADIGMMKVPARILKKEGELTDEEWSIVHNHPKTSAEFVNSMFRQKDFITSKIVLWHHERRDGSGYPSEISGQELEPYVPLLAVADSYFSMTSKRYFRSSKNPFDAIFHLNANAKALYNERAVQCMNYRIAPFPIGSVARFAANKAIHIVKLDNTPLEFKDIRIFTKGKREELYNIPKTVCSFVPRKTPKPVPTVEIGSHLDKIENPIDTFDLLALYGYTSNSKE